MQYNQSIDIANFFITGINYKKTDAATRSRFAISNEQYEHILQLAPAYYISSLFILSTCNRTEIYGFADDANQLIDLLCTQTEGHKAEFSTLAYIKKGTEAVEHLFNVAAGLDSQILGDYEIVGQLKQAVKFAKERNFINGLTERLFNCVLQASKSIKNDTALSDGTVSVSFTAVQYIKEHVTTGLQNKKILVVGTGKIGRNTCKNIVDYLGTRNVTLINRSEAKAAQLATELNLQHAPFSTLGQQVNEADIILLATNACDPVIVRSQLKNTGEKLIIDLSIPYNVEESAGNLPNITLVNVDKLSKLKDATLQKRETEVPKAKLIIARYMANFNEWCTMRKNAPLLNAIKNKLNELYLKQQLSATNTLPPLPARQKIQRVVNNVAFKLQDQNQYGCRYIEAINQFCS